jgi:hypothetical protein
LEPKSRFRVIPAHYQNVGGYFLRNSNGLYVIIGALIVVVAGLGAYIYHEQTKPTGVEMSIGQNGVSIEQK